MRKVDLNIAKQVINAVDIEYSANPNLATSVEIPVIAGPAVEVIHYINTETARELVIVAQADVAMTMTVLLVSINGITDFTAATINLLANTPSVTVITGLLSGARVQVALVGVIPGSMRAVAYARA